MECASKANDMQLNKPSKARTIHSSCLYRLRSYRWCFDNLHFVGVGAAVADTNNYRCHSPWRNVNTSPYGDFFFFSLYLSLSLPIISNINVELMIENFLSGFGEDNLWNNDNRKCRMENSSTKVQLWRSIRDLSGTRAYAPLSQAEHSHSLQMNKYGIFVSVIKKQ